MKSMLYSGEGRWLGWNSSAVFSLTASLLSRNALHTMWWQHVEERACHLEGFSQQPKRKAAAAQLTCQAETAPLLQSGLSAWPSPVFGNLKNKKFPTWIKNVI